MASLSRELVASADRLSESLAKIRFGAPAEYVYNPLEYAREMMRAYVETYARKGAPYLLLGMNPGPFGMAQTGVPFGEVGFVRDWLRLDANIGKPLREHPKRPIEGLLSKRSEVSGKRLWGAIREKFRTPERFFEKAFVANYCPLLFLEAAGRNLTPDKLGRLPREKMERACDAHLRETVAALKPTTLIGVGQYAANCAERALGDGIRIVVLPHPSPANPAANRGWDELAKRALAEQGVHDLL